MQLIKDKIYMNVLLQGKTKSLYMLMSHLRSSHITVCTWHRTWFNCILNHYYYQGSDSRVIPNQNQKWLRFFKNLGFSEPWWWFGLASSNGIKVLNTNQAY